MRDRAVERCMATRPESPERYHTCTCGASFPTTDELLEHAREEHGLGVY
jgi:hypothetical protein